MGCTKKYNKTLVDLARQSKIITGNTACFDGKIQSGIPFSGYPTGVDMTTLTNVGNSLPYLTCVFSGNSFTTLFDVSNPAAPAYNPIFDPYSASTWASNPIFSIYTSGLTLPITVYSALTQTVGPILFPSATGMTVDHPIIISYTGYSIQYSFGGVNGPSSFSPSSPPGTGFTSGFTSALQIFYTASSLDYRGPLDYLRSREDVTIDNRLTTKKLRVTGGASASTIGYVLTQVDEIGSAEWVFNSASASTNTFVVSGSLDSNADLNLLYNTGGAVPPIDLSALSGSTFTGNTSGDCISDLFVDNLHGCSPITFHSSLQHIGSSATGLNSIAWGSGNTSSDNFSSILGGQLNSITGNSAGCENNTIIGGSGNTMSGFGSATSDNNIILGGISNSMSARTIRSAIIGGDSNIIGFSGGTTANAVIVGGTGNVFPGLISAPNSVILGGTGITASTPATVYMNNLEVTQGNALIDNDLDGYARLKLQNLNAGTAAQTLFELHNRGPGGIVISGIICHMGPNFSSTALPTFQGEFLPSSLNITTGGGSGTDRSNINIGSRRGTDAETRFFGGSSDFDNSSLLGTFYTSGLTITDMVNTDKLRVRDGATNGFVLTSDSSGNATWAASTGGGSFSGGSGNCITDLFITNLHGCSPVTVYDNLQHISSSATGINSIAWGSGTTASGNYSYVEGAGNMSSGIASHAEGGLEVTEVAPFFSLSPTSATTGSAHAEGIGTLASGQGSHAEGKLTIASGHYSHAEGNNTQATGHTSHAEGQDTLSYGNRTHAEGEDTEARGDWSHSQGKNTLASGSGSFASGRGQIGKVIAGGDYSFAHFRNNIFPSVDGGAMGDYSAILGGEDHNIGDGADSSGIFGGVGNVIATGVTRSVILGGVNITGTTVDTVYVPNLNIGTVGVGNSINNLGIDSSGNVVTGTTFTGNTSGDCISDLFVTNIHGCSPVTFHSSLQHIGSSATGLNSIAWGTGTTASGDFSHAEGADNIAMGRGSHAEGGGGTIGTFLNIAAGVSSHAEGSDTLASGHTSHAEGQHTIASGTSSHAEGFETTAQGHYSHSEGDATLSSGEASHAEGRETIASGIYSHAEGQNTVASGITSHAEGRATKAGGDGSHAGGWGHLGKEVLALGEGSFAHFTLEESSGVNFTMGAQQDYSAILGGRDNNITSTGSDSVIIGGQWNNIDTPSSVYNAIIGGLVNSITGSTDEPASYCSIVGGTNNIVGGSGGFGGQYLGIFNSFTSELKGRNIKYSTIVGGSDHSIGVGASGAEGSFIGGGHGNDIGNGSHSAIIGGTDNDIGDFNRSVIIGGQNITADADDTAYVQNLEVLGQAYNVMYDVPTGYTSTTIIPDFNDGNIQTIVLSGGTAMVLEDPLVPSVSIKPGGTYMIVVKQDPVTGDGTLSYGSLYLWEQGVAPVITTGTNAIDILSFVGINVNGSPSGQRLLGVRSANFS